MINYLNIFAYQTFGLQQFSGSFLNWVAEKKENYTDKDIHSSMISEKINGNVLSLEINIEDMNEKAIISDIKFDKPIGNSIKEKIVI